jgi:hypothetical protein
MKAKEEVVTIYLVRWQSLTASLVRAESDEELLDILDQAANPDWCEYSVYDGPLAVDFRLPAEWHIRNERPGQPTAPDQIVVGNLGPLAQRYVVAAMEADLGVDEEGVRMAHLVLEKAFPAVHAAVEWLFTDEGLEQEPEGVLPEPRLRQALHAELARMLNASWRRAQLYRKTDPISTVAAQLDMPLALVRRLATELYNTGDKDRPVGDDIATDQTPADRPLFRVSNHHAQSCGEPPALDGDAAGKYVGYFMNEHGEQAIYSYDGNGEARIRVGDSGWEATYPVVNGEVADLKLTEAERTWLLACWLASGASQQKR